MSSFLPPLQYSKQTPCAIVKPTIPAKVISPSLPDTDKKGADDDNLQKLPPKKAKTFDVSSIPDCKVVLEKVFIKEDSIAARLEHRGKSPS